MSKELEHLYEYLKQEVSKSTLKPEDFHVWVTPDFAEAMKLHPKCGEWFTVGELEFREPPRQLNMFEDETWLKL